MKIMTQLEHDQLTPSGLMVHDHHPADPEPGHALPDRAPAARSSCTPTPSRDFTRFGANEQVRGGEASPLSDGHLQPRDGFRERLSIPSGPPRPSSPHVAGQRFSGVDRYVNDVAIQ